MSGQEIPVSFLCDRARLYGILHHPSQPSDCGVLLLAGRPALRSGRHRLFVLLARAWAESGTPVMRFDYRGSGDSEGEMGTLEQTHVDISAAIDAFQSSMPGLQEVVLWGQCGGAADAILYAPQDSRVTGVVLANPWLYGSRVRTLAALHRRGSQYLWKFRRMLSGSANSTLKTNPMEEPYPADGADVAVPLATSEVEQTYRSYRAPDVSRRLANSLEEFRGRVLVILSGKDAGAQAFKRTASLSFRWRRILSSPRVRREELPEANHSFRRPEWCGAAAAFTLEWLRNSS
jgi:exosortase A-associated hydrolase 1